MPTRSTTSFTARDGSGTYGGVRPTQLLLNEARRSVQGYSKTPIALERRSDHERCLLKQYQNHLHGFHSSFRLKRDERVIKKGNVQMMKALIEIQKPHQIPLK